MIQASCSSELCELVLGILGEVHQGGHPILCCMSNMPRVLDFCPHLERITRHAAMTSSLHNLSQWAQRFYRKAISFKFSVYLLGFFSTSSKSRLARSQHMLKDMFTYYCDCLFFFCYLLTNSQSSQLIQVTHFSVW